MSNLAKIPFSVPAGQGQEFALVADFFRLDVFPSGLTLGVNGQRPAAFPEGFVYKGRAGQTEVRLLRIENPTGGTLAGEFTHGTGDINLPGVTVISGTIPLPTGAATAANQATGNTTLGSILTALADIATATLQTAANTLLTTISTTLSTIAAKLPTLNTVVTPRVLDVNPGGDVDITGARQIAVLNTHTSLSLTIVISGQPNFTLGPGQSVDWPLLHPWNAAYPMIRITAPASATGAIQYVL